MKGKALVCLAGLVLGLAVCGTVWGQGRRAGTLKGTVKTEAGEAVPGVTVTVEGPTLQGQRVALTGINGDYVARNLPPGAYTVTFELEGMTTTKAADVEVRMGQESTLNIAMVVEAAEETIQVTGELPNVLASSQVSTTYDFEEVNNLPITRTPSGIALLAPGVTGNTPNPGSYDSPGQITISGGFAYDNVFLIDGVDANDNLFGTSNSVYIEDAIADTQVLTSGISAEYGRFSGGVVNIITKSGGNHFHGTFRSDLSNPSWTDETPFEEERGISRADTTNKAWSATLGGYALKDRLWFFLAGRDAETSSQDTFQTGQPRPTVNEEDRFEYKLTATVAEGHQIQGAFVDRENTGLRTSFSFSISPDTLRTRTDPNTLVVGRYSGIFTPSLFGDLQYSEKEFQFNNTHGDEGLRLSPFLDFRRFEHYNFPYFDGSDPEDRNNEQLTASLSYFVNTAQAGTHDLKVGFEDFTSTRTGGNSQSVTNFVFDTPAKRDANGQLVIGPDGKLIPVWTPCPNGDCTGVSNFTRLRERLPDRDAAIDIQTLSVYINDSWRLGDHWSFNVGFRYEDVDSLTNANIVTVNASRLVPRLAAIYDLKGDGKYLFDATFGQYSGKYSEAQFAENTTVGNPLALNYIYTGPAGEGLDFDPGFDVRGNYEIFSANNPIANVFTAGDIKSPVVEELTLSAGMRLERGGYLKLVYSQRDWDDFIEDFITQETGSTDVEVLGNPVGTFANTVIDNSSAPTREYQALQLIGRYRLQDNFTLDGSWTYQIKNEGNFRGENTNQPGISSNFHDYPEAFDSRNRAFGRLPGFQRHKIRVWGNYLLDLHRAGDLNFGALVNYDSATTFSFSDTVGLSQLQTDILSNLYPNIPSSQTLWFGERGRGKYEDAWRLDLSVNYVLPVFKRLDLWIKGDVLNVTNQDALISFEDQVDAILDGPVDELGRPTTFEPVANFGQATGSGDYQLPRTFRFTVGLRF